MLQLGVLFSKNSTGWVLLLLLKNLRILINFVFSEYLTLGYCLLIWMYHFIDVSCSDGEGCEERKYPYPSSDIMWSAGPVLMGRSVRSGGVLILHVRSGCSNAGWPNWCAVEQWTRKEWRHQSSSTMYAAVRNSWIDVRGASLWCRERDEFCTWCMRQCAAARLMRVERHCVSGMRPDGTGVPEVAQHGARAVCRPWR